MADQIDRILDLVRTMKTPQVSWKLLLELCAAAHPSDTSAKLPTPDFSRDVKMTSEWFSEELSANGEGRPGIYLGLDTLNMEDRGPRYVKPKNIEIGFSSAGAPAKLDLEYIYKCDNYGSDHLIESLRDLKRVYHQADISSEADYELFLGYSGVVLLAAIEQLHTRDFIATWGFHDGDMFLLCRRYGGRYERIVRL